MPTEKQAFDMGYADGYHGDTPSFTGPWPQFHAYYKGYEYGLVCLEQDRIDEEEN